MMTKQQAAVFWMSLLGAILCAVGGALLGATEFENEAAVADAEELVAENETDNAEPVSDVGEDSEEADGNGLLTTIKQYYSLLPPEAWLAVGLMGVIGFWAAWHGASVTLNPLSPRSGALAGFISAGFIALAFLATVPVTCWILQFSLPKELSTVLLMGLGAGLFAWQFGFWATRPWASRAEVSEAHGSS